MKKNSKTKKGKVKMVQSMKNHLNFFLCMKHFLLKILPMQVSTFFLGGNMLKIKSEKEFDPSKIQSAKLSSFWKKLNLANN